MELTEIIQKAIREKGYNLHSYCKRIAPKTKLTWQGINNQIKGTNPLTTHNLKIIAEDLNTPTQHYQHLLTPPQNATINQILQHYIELNGHSIKSYSKHIAPQTKLQWPGIKQQILGKRKLTLDTIKTIAKDLNMPKKYYQYSLQPSRFATIREILQHYIELNGHKIEDYSKQIAPQTKLTWTGIVSQINGRAPLTKHTIRIIAEDLNIPQQHYQYSITLRKTSDMNQIIQHHMELNQHKPKPYSRKIAQKTKLKWGGIQNQIRGKSKLTPHIFKIIAEDLNIPTQHTDPYLTKTEFKDTKELIEWHIKLNTPHQPLRIYKKVAEKTKISDQRIRRHIKSNSFPNNSILYELAKTIHRI